MDMFALRRLLSRLGIKRFASHRYALDERTYSLLETLAVEEQRPAEEIHADLLANGLRQRDANELAWQRWQSLSARERDVAALTCLGNTNKQIAARLHLSPETVKSYMRQVSMKFQVHGKEELRMLIGHWDFHAWDQ